MLRNPIADVNAQPPRENYSYYGVNGRPYTDDPGMMTREEFQAQTIPVIRAGYGNFDTAKVDEVHFGRTLNEVLSKTQTGEYKILGHNQQWVQCSKFGVRVMHYIQWIEYSNRPPSTAVKGASRRPPKHFMQSEL